VCRWAHVIVHCLGPKLPDKDYDYEVFAFQRWVGPEGKGDTKLPGYNIVVKAHEGEDVSNNPKLRQSDDDTVPQTNPDIDDPAKMAQYRKDNGFAWYMLCIVEWNSALHGVYGRIGLDLLFTL